MSASALNMTLEKWAQIHFGDAAPHIVTLRRWCRTGKIYPQPKKVGRTYFVDRCAQYVGDYNSPEFLGSLRDATQAQ